MTGLSDARVPRVIVILGRSEDVIVPDLTRPSLHPASIGQEPSYR
jgi:hypothetical protein